MKAMLVSSEQNIHLEYNKIAILGVQSDRIREFVSSWLETGLNLKTSLYLLRKTPKDDGMLFLLPVEIHLIPCNQNPTRSLGILTSIYAIITYPLKGTAYSNSNISAWKVSKNFEWQSDT